MSIEDPPATTHEAGGRVPPTTYEGGGAAPPTAFEGGTPSTRRRRLVLPDPLLEEFEYLADLSSGSQADVVLCRRRSDGQEFAVKLFRGSLGSVDRAAMARLEGADPDHVVPIVDVQTWQDETWEVQEYFPLGSLADLFADRDGPLDGEQARELLTELTAAVAHIHERDIVHRDLKPANVLLRTIDPLDCVIADFGLATQLLASRAARSVAGTMAYTAPEATYGDLQRAADWWSLGVITHEALTGRHLFHDPATGHLLSDHQIRVSLNQGTYEIRDLPDERWSLVIRGLLTHDPEHRWNDTQVTAWLAGESPEVVAPRVTGTSAARRGVAPFQLGDASCHTPAELAAVIRQDFDRGEALLADVLSSERLRSWLAAHGLSEAVGDIFGRISNRKVLTMRLVQLQLILDPESDPVFRDRALTMASIQDTCTRATQGDAAAIAWITDLRDHQVLGAWASELGNGQQIAAADERLRTWWTRIDTRVTGEAATRTKQSLPACEGVLLQAALSEATRASLEQQATAALAGDDSILPAWARTLAELARTDDPDLLGVRVLATGVVPAQRRIVLAERHAAEQRRLAEAEAERQRRHEQEAAARRQQAVARAARRRGTDVAAMMLTGAACVTVLGPWLLGHFLLQDGYFREPDGRVFNTEARDVGDYFLTDWIAGCSVLVLLLAAFLLVRPWTGRVPYAIAGAVIAVGTVVGLIPLAVGQWNDAEQDTLIRLRTTEFPFEEHYLTCGGATASFKSDYAIRYSETGGEPWSVFLGSSKGGDDECDLISIWHGWERVDRIQLQGKRRAIGVDVNSTNSSKTVFVVHTTGGPELRVHLRDYYEPWR